MYDPRQLPAWKELQGHFAEVQPLHMRDLFRAEPGRFAKFSRRLGDLLLDFSKNRITEKTFGLLIDLARQAKVPEAAQAMFRGDKINTTEHRAVLHVALRNRDNHPILVDGKDVMPLVNGVL